MPVPLAWFAVALSTTLINAGALGIVAHREKNRKLTSWAAAWALWGLAGGVLALMGGPSVALAPIASGILWVCSSLLFLDGCYRLVDRSMPRAWFVIALLAVTLALALGIGVRGDVGMIPLVMFQCLGLLATGVLVIRLERRRLGAWMSGLALILLALHILDAPLVAAHPVLMPWGFVLATALQVLAALGMIVLHYERARERMVQSELALERNERIRSLGRAAGSVAHDFNNLLTIMQGQLDLHRLSDRPEEKERALAALQNAIEQSRRFTALLLSVGQRAIVRPEDIDLRRVVGSQLDLLRDSIPERIQLRFRCLGEPVIAQVDRGLLEQIVMNLVTNARDAIEGEGEIQVELERVEQPTPTVALRVRDSGRGIEANLLDRMFEPFFTTKPPGRGTGLGLASVRGAVNQLGGRVQVESVPRQGSCFEVQFPL